MSRTESATLVCTEATFAGPLAPSFGALARPYRELQVPVVLLASHIDGECLRFTCCNVTNRSGPDKATRAAIPTPHTHPRR
jgi:hypothetical protein